MPPKSLSEALVALQAQLPRIPKTDEAPGFQCCKHCQYTDPHELPHKEMCDHGCNDAELIDRWDESHA